MRTHRPGQRTRRRRRLPQRLRLYQHRNHRSRIQTKRPMSQHPQNTRNLPTMARHTDPRTRIGHKNLIQHRLTAHRLRAARLGRHPIPQLIARGKARLEAPAGHGIANDGARAAPIARVDADALAQAVLDRRHERLRRRQQRAQPRERDVGRLQTPEEGRGVVGLGRGDLFDAQGVCPEVGGRLGLRDARRVEVCVRPGCAAVAVDFGPVAVPGGRAVEGLGGVVVAFAVAPEE